MANVDLAVRTPVGLAEGPVWDERRNVLWWVDVFGGVLHSLDPDTGADTSSGGEGRLASVALCEDGALLLARERKVLRYVPDGPRIDVVASVDRGTWLNDSGCDAAGRLVIGTMVDERDAGTAALYQLVNGKVAMLLSDVTISNGLDWSLDGTTLYYVDTPLERIDAFDYDPGTGALSRRRVFVDLHDVPGRPDGLTVDAEGGVWVAMAKGGRAVRRFTPDGAPDAVVDLPVPNATSVAFGGTGRQDLYVTTSQLRMTPQDLAEYPLSGCVFRVTDLGWRGLPTRRYAG